MEQIVYAGPHTGPVFVPAFGLRAMPGEPVEVTAEQAEALVGAGWERVAPKRQAKAGGSGESNDAAGGESTEDEE